MVTGHNEVLASPSKDAVCGIFVTNGGENEPRDKVADRVNALDKRRLIEQQLGVEVPILIFGRSGIKEYDTYKQLSDLLVTCSRPVGIAHDILTENRAYYIKVFLQLVAEIQFVKT